MTQASLSLHGHQIRTVFDLGRRGEVGATAALGYMLSRTPTFSRALVRRFLGNSATVPSNVGLEVRETGEGRFDVQMIGPDYCVVIEAKWGWLPPSVAQMKMYARRVSRQNVRHRLLVTLSNAASGVAGHSLPQSLFGIDVKHLQWRDIAGLARHVLRAVRGADRRMLMEFIQYLERTVMGSSKPEDFVYVVALSEGRSKSWNVSWKDAVMKQRVYFHPVGLGYPHEPPTYMGFRYDGMLRSIHRVVDSQVITCKSQAIPGASDRQMKPHFLHRLGKPFLPNREVRSGRVWNSRVWCRLDELLTAKTIAQAAQRSSYHLEDLG